MKRDWLEDKLIENLSNDIQSDIDLDSVWEDIENIRYPNKRRRPVLWLLPLFVGIVSIAFWFVHNNKDAKIIDNKSFTLSSEKGNIETQDVGESKPNSRKVIAPTVLKASTIETSTATETNYDITKSSVSSTINAENRKVVNPDNREDIRQSTSGTPNNDQSPTNQIFVDQNSMSSGLSNTTKEISSEGFYKQPIDKVNTLIDNNKIQLSTISRSNMILQIIPSSITLPILQKKMNLDIPCADAPLYSHASKSWAIGIRYSFGISEGSLKGDHPTILNRINQENNLDVHQLEIQLNKPFGTNFFIGTGLEYTQHAKVFKDSYSNTTVEERANVIIEIINRNDGTTEYIRGTGIATITETGQITNYQRYRTLAVPITLGYNLPLSRRIHLQINAGLSIGSSLWNKGFSYKDDDGISITLERLGYTSTFYMSQKTALGIKSEITESLLFNFGFNSNIDITNRNTLQGINNKFNRYGMYFGLNKIF